MSESLPSSIITGTFQKRRNEPGVHLIESGTVAPPPVILRALTHTNSRMSFAKMISSRFWAVRLCGVPSTIYGRRILQQSISCAAPLQLKALQRRLHDA
jgi:hypothetical protein